MPAPIALQLYSVRDALAQNFDATLERVAAIGYAGVETGGFANGSSPAATAQQFQSLGLAVCGYHTGLPLGDNAAELLDLLAAYDCRRLVCAWQPPELFKSLAGLQQVADKLNAANAWALDNGLTFGYHNHWAEFELFEGRPAHERLRELVAPEVFFEVDVYWAQTAGADPAAVVRDLGPRAPLLHLKDGPAKQGVPMQALGDGVVDIPACVAAGAAHTEWLIVELDECATDMFTAVDRSYQYLLEKDLGRGQG
jgi:sugar phosphate isomerase/epimerase